MICGYWITANGALRATYTKPSFWKRIEAAITQDWTWVAVLFTRKA